MGEENRHKMMQNLFGDQSEEEEIEELSSEHEATQQSDYLSDEGEGEGELEGEGEGESEGEGEVEVEGQGESEVESDVEMHDVDPDPGESEGERAQNSPERDVSDQGVESEGIEAESDEQDEEYGQRVVTSWRKEVIDSASEGNRYVHNEDEEVDQVRRSSRSPSEEKEETHIAQSAAEIRDVFGDSDEEEPAEYATQNSLEPQSPVSGISPLEEEGTNDKNLRPDEDAKYESEEDNIEQKSKEKPVGPPLELEIPLRPPPGQTDKVNMIKVSNIMGIEPRPFDPKAYVEEDMFVTDESGSKKRIRLENNIVRWRSIRNLDGTSSYESNARFVRWSDGSLQLLLGNEVLDITVQDAQHDQAHLFLRHGKGILQSQGRLLRKMRFMPSSLLSNSHRLLTALVDSRHKKVYKVKNCVTHIDPEREKEEKEKAEGQTIKANELLHRKREKVDKKYAQTVERGHQLSPGFLEEALDEDEDDHEPRRSAAQDRFVEDLEVEAQVEKRILNAKRVPVVHKDIPRKPAFSSVKSSRRPVDFSDSENEESVYESHRDEGKRSPLQKREEEPEHEGEEEEEEAEQDEEDTGASEESEEPRRSKGSGNGLKRKEVESDADSPPKKTTSHRRMAIVFDSDEE